MAKYQGEPQALQGMERGAQNSGRGEKFEMKKDVILKQYPDI